MILLDKLLTKNPNYFLGDKFSGNRGHLAKKATCWSSVGMCIFLTALYPNTTLPGILERSEQGAEGPGKTALGLEKIERVRKETTPGRRGLLISSKM